MDPNELTISHLTEVSVERAKEWHGGTLEAWSPSDWMVAMMGEIGEAANVLKKLNRVRDGVLNRKRETKDELMRELAEEMADGALYMVLFCARMGIDLPQEIVWKFNNVSEQQGFPQRL